MFIDKQNRPKILTISALALSAVLLSACAADEPSDLPGTPSPELPTETKATEEPSTDPDAVAEPGATFAIGDTAILEYPVDDDESEIDNALLSATVLEIEEADLEDLEPLEMGDRLEGLTPFYIHINIKGVDETSENLAGTVFANPFTGAYDGVSGQNLNVIGTFEPCNVQSLDSAWDADATQDICVITMAPAGETINSVLYAPSNTDYQNDPVVWETRSD